METLLIVTVQKESEEVNYHFCVNTTALEELLSNVHKDKYLRLIRHMMDQSSSELIKYLSGMKKGMLELLRKELKKAFSNLSGKSNSERIGLNETAVSPLPITSMGVWYQEGPLSDKTVLDTLPGIENGSSVKVRVGNSTKFETIAIDRGFVIGLNQSGNTNWGSYFEPLTEGCTNSVNPPLGSSEILEVEMPANEKGTEICMFKTKDLNGIFAFTFEVTLTLLDNNGGPIGPVRCSVDPLLKIGSTP